MTWRERGACWDTDSTMFFFKGAGFHTGKRAQVSKAICATCSVIGDCLEYAQRERFQYGIWGGMTVKERQAARRRVA